MYHKTVDYQKSLRIASFQVTIKFNYLVLIKILHSIFLLLSYQKSN